MIRLALRVRRQQAEIALAELLALAPAGVEEVDLGDAGIEYAVYGAPGELPSLPDLKVAVGGALVNVCTREVADDWSLRWRQFHRPVLVLPPREAPEHVPALHVRPPWERPREAGRDSRTVKEIVIDPAQAFGTGAHATTRMCLELLLELCAHGVARGPLIDIGCGSGVLSIAAAHLGWAPVLGLDHERESVSATHENARVNGVAVNASIFDLREHDVRWPAGPRPVIAANLVRPLLLHLAQSMTAAPAHLLASGVLAEEADEVVAAFGERLGLAETDRRHSGEWAALWLTSSPR